MCAGGVITGSKSYLPINNHFICYINTVQKYEIYLSNKAFLHLYLK